VIAALRSPGLAPPLALGALLFGCAAGAPPAATSGGGLPPAAGVADPAAPPPIAGAPAAAAPPAPAPAKVADLPRAEPPAPLSEAEQKEAEKKCKPLLDAVRKPAKGDTRPALARLRSAIQKPPRGLPAGDLDRCADLLGRGFRGYVYASFEVEARAILGRMSREVIAAFQQEGALCPATERPVPADVSKVAISPYESTAADWDAPTWRCLHFSMEGQSLHFQYELRTDPKAMTFELIARGSPEKDGKFVELSQRGVVKNGRAEVEGAVRR
jgi:hypothetical protein